jgi:hypothetical protein
MPAELADEGYYDYPDKDNIDVEATHYAADQHGYDLGTTPLDNLMANQALGFDTAGAMADGGTTF